MIVNNIKKFRKEFGLTQRELGELVAMDPKSAQQKVARLEDGAEAKIEMAFRISEVLGQRVEDIFPGLKKYMVDSNSVAANETGSGDDACDAEGKSLVFLNHPAFDIVTKEVTQVNDVIAAFEKTANEYSSLIKSSHYIPIKFVEYDLDAIPEEEQSSWHIRGRLEFEVYKHERNLAANSSTYEESAQICGPNTDDDTRCAIDFFHDRKIKLPQGAIFAAVLGRYAAITWMIDEGKEPVLHDRRKPHLCLEFTTVFAVEHVHNEETRGDFYNARMTDSYYRVTSIDSKYENLTVSKERILLEDCDYQTKKLVIDKYLTDMADLMLRESDKYFEKTGTGF